MDQKSYSDTFLPLKVHKYIVFLDLYNISIYKDSWKLQTSGLLDIAHYHELWRYWWLYLPVAV